MTLRTKNIKALPIPKMARQMVVWQNSTANKVESLSFAIDDESGPFEVRFFSPGPTLSRKHYVFGVLIEIDGVPAPVWFSSVPLQERVKKFSGGKSIHDLPIDLRAELFELALRPLINLLVLHTNTNIRILNFLSIKPTSIHDLSIGFHLSGANSSRLSAIIVMHEKLRPVTDRMLAHWPNKPFLDWGGQLIRLWIECGHLSLSMNELDALEVNDILLVENSEDIRQLNFYLRLPTGDFFRAQVNPQQIIFQTGLIEMSDSANNEDIASLEEIPVKLTFDLGTMEIPYRELKMVTEGYVVDLKKTLPRAVTIRSGNNRVGEGDLVDIDGNIGVRIRKLWNTPRAE